MKFLPSAISTPHSASGGCAPSPRYPSDDPSRIASAISVIQYTRIGEIAFGNKCRKMIRLGPYPMTRPAAA